MPQKSDKERNLTKEIGKYGKIQEEYSVVSSEIVETLKKLKKTQKEYLDLVKKHQDYWNSELEKTEYKNTERRKKLKETLKKEEIIRKKLEKELKRADERIEFHRKHIRTRS